MTRVLTPLYGLLLRLYPRQFRVEFGTEMQSVFAEAVSDEPGPQSLLLFLRELCDLPGSLLEAYAARWSRGGSMVAQEKCISPATRWQTLIGVLPFLAFGIASIIGKVDPVLGIRGHDAEMAVYCLALFGLLIGWIRGFPLWSYGYLGWSLLIAWFNTNLRVHGVNWGYRVWVPLGFTAVVALLWTRSLAPLKRLLLGIWRDWTRLTFAMYAFGAFVSLIYDENHHPNLLLLMAIATLIITAGAWAFLRSSNLLGRVLSVAVSFVVAVIPMAISYLTWDWRAHYRLPPSDRWVDNLGVSPIGILFWLLILFWPALLGLVQRIVARHPVGQ